MTTSIDVDDGRFSRLVRFNLIIGAVHALSGAAMLALGNDFSIDVSTVNLNGPPGTPLSAATLQDVGSIPLAPATAAFLS